MSTLKFTQEVKGKWLARLRDPNSKQAHNMLKTSDGAMCCLEHACAVIMPDYVEPAVDMHELPEGNDPEKKFIENNRHYNFMKSLIGNEMNRLIDLNDGQRFTLPQIADYIEANIPAVKE